MRQPYILFNILEVFLSTSHELSQVKCDNGESLDPAGPQTFSIECQGATVDVQGNNGKLHCSECPKCSGTNFIIYLYLAPILFVI